MRAFWLALLLALPPSALRAELPKLGKAPESAHGKALPVGKDLKVAVADCRTEEDSARLDASVRAAVERVDSCLQKENPGIAAKIRSHFHKFTFHCGYTGGMAGGNTEFNTDGSADVFVNFRAHGVQYGMGARTFHEMIHATDPKGELMLSASAHARAGYPDPVYGCQLDCYPEGISDDERKEIARLGNALSEENRQVPLAEVSDCPSGMDCATYSAYAGICRGGKVLATKKVRDADKKANAPKCFAEAVLNACDGACKGSKGSPVCKKSCAFSSAPDADKGGMIGDYKELGGRLAGGDEADGQGLEGDDLALYRDGQKRKLFAACR